METLTLTQKEQARLQVLNSLLAEHMTLEQAATLMGVSARHARRIHAAYRKEGAAALAHGNRGLRSANATSETKKAEVLRLAQTRCPAANHTHLSELLEEGKRLEHRAERAPTSPAHGPEHGGTTKRPRAAASWSSWRTSAA